MPNRLLPTLNETNRHFWTGGKQGALLITRCGHCGYYVHPPAPVCRQCKAIADLKPQAVSGRATVLTFTVNYHPWGEGQEPYVLALVGLEEQADLRLTTNIVNCPIEDVHIGMAVEVVFENVEEMWVPLFQPLSGSGPGQSINA
jgi:uncharacterized OB-fold protein